MLRYGRTAHDYSMSSAHTVFVRMSAADAEFLCMIVEREEQTGGAIPIDGLIILSRLRNERRLRTADLAKSVRKPETLVRGTLEKLVEAGMVKARGTGRTYTLSAKVYQGTGQKAAYVRQAGFDVIQQEKMVLNLIDTHGSIKRAGAADLCHISSFQATRLLNRLKDKGVIRPLGQEKGPDMSEADKISVAYEKRRKIRVMPVFSCAVSTIFRPRRIAVFKRSDFLMVHKDDV